MSRFSMWGKEDRAIQASWEPAASLFSENVDKEKTAYSFPSLCVGDLATENIKQAEFNSSLHQSFIEIYSNATKVTS